MAQLNKLGSVSLFQTLPLGPVLVLLVTLFVASGPRFDLVEYGQGQ
jgi:hypothetical protein